MCVRSCERMHVLVVMVFEWTIQIGKVAGICDIYFFSSYSLFSCYRSSIHFICVFALRAVWTSNSKSWAIDYIEKATRSGIKFRIFHRQRNTISEKEIKMSMLKNLQDCYFFYYSACRKVNWCISNWWEYIFWFFHRRTGSQLPVSTWTSRTWSRTGLCQLAGRAVLWSNVSKSSHGHRKGTKSNSMLLGK